LEDRDIVALYWRRDEDAIAATAQKYGSYCRIIGYNILRDEQDAEECVNDTYARAWDSMPSNRPDHLAPYLGKLTRWIALDRLKWQNSQKRGGKNESSLSLEDIGELTLQGDSVQNELEYHELCMAINGFLQNLSATERQVFLARYWYMANIREIARQFHFHESKVKSMLMRTRSKLMNYLKEEGLC